MMPLHLLMTPCFAFIHLLPVKDIIVVKIRFPNIQNWAKLVHGLPFKMFAQRCPIFISRKKGKTDFFCSVLPVTKNLFRSIQVSTNIYFFAGFFFVQKVFEEFYLIFFRFQISKKDECFFTMDDTLTRADEPAKPVYHRVIFWHICPCKSKRRKD